MTSDPQTGPAARLFGLDLGSTTSSMLVASAPIVRDCVTGRREFGRPTILHRAEPVFTPFAGERLDEPRLRDLFDQWIDGSRIDPGRLLCGGAIVTGLAARASNAAAVARLVRERFGEALVVTADDPGLESWLAFLGNCLDLSRAHPETVFWNLDIGGGTTNLAQGVAGEVRQIGCYFIGARHVRVVPGTWRIEGLSPLALRLFEHLGIARRVGDVLEPAEVDAVVGFYVRILEALVCGDAAFLAQDPVRMHEQVAFPGAPPAVGGEARSPGGPALTFSGGVGELIYRCARGEPLPPRTAFGDLGIELARHICRSPLLSKDLAQYVPIHLGRATILGLTLHHAELSGATLYLPCPEALPLPELPVVGRWGSDADEARLRSLLDLAQRGRRGACVQVDLPLESWQTVKEAGRRLAQAVRETAWPADRPLVLLVSRNVGKALGHYATDWGRLPLSLIVIDEVPLRRARFVSLGRPGENVVPVSFYGLESEA